MAPIYLGKMVVPSSLRYIENLAYHLTGNDSVLVDQFHTRASDCSRVSSSLHIFQLVVLLQPASGPDTEEVPHIVIGTPIILHVVAALEEGDQVHVHHHWLLLVTRGGAECQVQHSSFILSNWNLVFTIY